MKGAYVLLKPSHPDMEDCALAEDHQFLELIYLS